MRVYLLGAYTPDKGFCEHAADVSQRKKTTRGVRALCGTKVQLRQFNAVYVRSYTCKKCALRGGKGRGVMMGPSDDGGTHPSGVGWFESNSAPLQPTSEELLRQARAIVSTVGVSLLARQLAQRLEEARAAMDKTLDAYYIKGLPLESAMEHLRRELSK